MASEPKITEDIQRMLLPLISALSTFKNDVAFGEKHERPGLSNSTYGKPFAVFRVKERLFYADLLSAVGAFEALGLLPVADASVPVSDAAPRTSARTPPPRHTHAPVKEPVHTDDKASDAPTEDTPFAAPTPTPPPAPAPHAPASRCLHRHRPPNHGACSPAAEAACSVRLATPDRFHQCASNL